MKMPEVRVLSMWDPWATLVVYGKKQMETRPKPTNWRGIYLIQATNWNKHSAYACISLKEHLLDVHGFTPGHIIGSVECMDCLQITNHIDTFLQFDKHLDIFSVPKQELELGDYAVGRYAWVFANPKRFRAPIKHTGTQSYYGRYKGVTEILEAAYNTHFEKNI